ncbi:hypothetical protein [Streptomyces sp. DH12]|uniref:hypothetical protein n=1 Tax=Streptomyces sp. DH12 TaxID=2857010 RepID=UPI001E5D4CC3|nr:hypothetical protein [Streptomyces sp. DH12]
MTTARRPFSVRAGLTAATHDGPYEGAPQHLEAPLQQWVLHALTLPGGMHYDVFTAKTVCLRLRIPAQPGSDPDYVSPLTAARGTDLLDVIDAVLCVRAGWVRKHHQQAADAVSIAGLSHILNEGGSAYRVMDDHAGLEERVTPAAREAVRRTIAEAQAATTVGSAADHLDTAWRAAYGRNPDPVRAYSEAIKAVESAAQSVVQPNHPKATLGTMRGEIRGARNKFRSALHTPAGSDPVAAVEAMMSALWGGQTSRHGGQAATVAETLDAARAAVHLAATLVQWFLSGAVMRTP